VLLHDLNPLDGNLVGLTLKLTLENWQFSDLLQREKAEAPINVEVKVFLELVAAEFENLLAHFASIVGELGLVLDGVFVDSGNVLGVELNLEVVGVELEGFDLLVLGASGLFGEKSG
jgi:hypothetical protein